MADRVVERYGNEGERGCPGESECETFLSSAEDQPPEARCPSCPRWQSAKGENKDNSLTESSALVDSIESIVRERDSGFGFPKDLTELEKQLVMVWDDTTATLERAHQTRVAVLFESLMAMQAK